MINVEQITIDLTLPTDEVSVVAMQPYLELQLDEPFKLRENLVEDQLSAIRKTLALAQNSFNDRSAHFTIFPEYSILGLQGIEIINQEISSTNWSNGSVILAGTHGLTKDEFQEICERFEVNVSDENNPENVTDERWVNCCFILVKENNGEIKRWAQLKIRPAWAESRAPCNDLCSGSTIYVFNCNYSNNFPFSFTTLICFDWVASLNGSNVRDELLNRLQEQINNVPLHLDWVFVIQHNDSPNHSTFLNSTINFLSDPNHFPIINRNETVVLHANTAASEIPSRKGDGAFSACIFSPRTQFDLSACKSTICMQPSNLRESNIINEARCKDVVFREMGRCIHRFKIRIPRFTVPNPTDRIYPVLNAEVHSTNNENDPRLSGKTISASLKWINDVLDGIKSLASLSLENCSLQEVAEGKHKLIVDEMRLIEDGKNISEKINWAACFKASGIVERDKDRCKNPDLWDYPVSLETYALEHIVHSLTNLGLAYTLDLKDSSLHGILTSDDPLVQVVAIRGESFSDCCTHFKDNILNSKNINDPILVVVRDKNNLKATEQEFAKYYEPNTDTGLKYLDYQTLVDLSRNADSVKNLKEQLDDRLPTDRKII